HRPPSTWPPCARGLAVPMIDRSVAAVRRGSWGPLHATIFGAWFAPFAAMAWVGWALSAYSGAAAVTPATASLLLTLVLLAIAVRLYWRARPVAMPSYFQSGRFWALFWGV